MKPRVKRKLMWERKGVSEVVGTILMLAITVVMFSSIMVWVGNFPTPQAKAYVEISGTVTPADADNWTAGAWINLTHSGGVTLVGYWTDILLDIDGVRMALSLSDSLVDVGDEWEAGETFSYFVPAGSITETSSVTGMIVDRDKDSIVWNSDLRGGGNTFAPIIRNVWIDSDLATVVDEPGPVGFENDTFMIYAKIVDPEADDPEHGLNASNVWVNLSSIGRGMIRLEDDDFDNVFTNTSKGAVFDYSPGYYHMVVSATDYDGNMDNYTFWFSVGGEFAQNPQIAIYANNDTSTNIWTEPPNPQNGQQVRLYATVRNLGGSGAHITVKFYDQNTSGTIPIGEKTDVGMGIGEQDVWIPWTARPGGIHNITVWAFINNNSANYGLVDTYPNDDMNSTDITVFPTILLVDDDQSPNNRGLADTVNFMQAALDASDFDYDMTIVNTGGNGPGYDYGDFKMMEYDIVIWMTGYEETSTLTSTDIGELSEFLDNGGSMWMLGHGIFVEAGSNIALATFINDYLNTSGVAPIITGTEDINGIQNHNVTDYFYGNMLNLTERVAGEMNAYELDDSNAFTETAFIGNTTLAPYAVSNVNTVLDRKLFVQSFEFSMIDNTADQAQLAFLVITWLADIEARFGRDLAVSEQIMEPSTIYYKQEVTITGVIRNNAINFTEDAVEWRLTIISPSGSTRIIVNSTDQASTDPEFISVGTGRNNSVAISLSWIPEEIGPHSIVFEVDPNDRIDETNEDNNQFSDLLVSDDVNVNYRILVVDDDEVVGGVNETAQVQGALDYLGYAYETHVVQNGDPGPSQENLTNYNAVLWVGGDVDNPLTTGAGMDEERIEYYLDNGGRFWLVGANCLGTSLSFYEDSLFKISSLTTNTGMPSVLNGVDIPDGEPDYWDYFSHGMAYDTVGGASADSITPWPAIGVPVFYQDDAQTQYNSVRYEDTATNYKTVVSTFSLDYLADNESKAEFLFMMLKWFDMPETRAEARITVPDIWVSSTHPQLGDSYIIQATVYNPGGDTANVLVRFMDGNTQIGSDSISIGANSRTTAEVVWTPLFAGQRNINIFVDPIQEQSEIFEWSNNNATVSLYVYFFWDDMETDASKWSHESTILLINGESALDYFSDTTLYTNITTEWDSTLSSYVAESTDDGFYHTYDKAAWLQEPYSATTTTVRIPIDVVFALDTSGSMSNSDIQNMRDATKNLIGQLTPDDRAAIWTFDGGGWEVAQPLLLEPYAYMDTANKTLFNTSIDAPSFDTGGYTCFYDTVGEAIQYTQDNILPNRLEFVIAMTDGVSNSDDQYTPETNWGSTTTSDPQDYNQDDTPASLNGLLYPPAMVYSIGLGINHDPAYPTAPDSSRISPNPTTYPVEYDVWHIADSSPDPLNDAGGKYGENQTTGEDNVGKYFYTTDSSQLPSIFQNIFEDIQQTVVTPENVTRGGGTPAEDNPQPLATPSPPQPMVTIWSDGFESGDFSAWTSVGSQGQDWDVITTSDFDGRTREPRSGTYSATCRDSNGINDYLQKDGLDLTGYTNVQLSFWYHYEDIETNERLALDVYHDGGWDNNVWNPLGTNNGDRGTTQPEYVQAVVDISALLATPDQVIRIRFEANSNWDWPNDECALDDVVLSGDATGGGGPVPPTILYNYPNDGQTDVPVDQDIAIVFNEDMDVTTLSYTIVPNPGGLVETWSGGDTVLTISHANFTNNQLYTITINDCRDQNDGLSATNVPYTFSFTTAASGGGPIAADPYIVYTYPVDGDTDVNIGVDVSIVFSEPMNTGTVTYTCTPDPGGWTESWNTDDTVLTLSHNDFGYSTTYTVEVTAGEDLDGNPLSSGVTIDFTDFESGWNGWTGAGAQNEWERGNPTDPGISPYSGSFCAEIDLNNNYNNNANNYLYKTIDLTGYSNSQMTFWHYLEFEDNYDGGSVMVSNDGGVSWNLAPPDLPSSGWDTSIDGNSNYFNDLGHRNGWTGDGPMGTNTWEEVTVDLSAYDGQSIIIRFWFSSDGSVNDDGWAIDDIRITGSVGAAPNPWSFTTEAFQSGGGGGGGNGTGDGTAPPGPNYNKSAVTESFDLRNVASSTLSFWHKYNIVSGVNGGVLMVGYRESAGGPFKFKYVVPSSAYTGNMRLSDTNRVDDMGVWMRWAWNGVSGGGTFSWEKVSLDILPYVNKTGVGGYDPLSEVKVKFAYYQYGPGTGYGWYIDDVRVTVSRSDYSNPDAYTSDIWNRTTADAHSGLWSWSNVDPVTGEVKGGIDNSLITNPIDLTNARTATLSAYFKFNINTDDGAPPDGFRVEVSKDNGVNWEAINLGVRSAWGVSGTGADSDDGNTSDGKTYTGFTDSGEGSAIADGYWVEAGTLTRLNCDLSSFSGNAIMIRFRVVTTNHPLYAHDDNAASGDPGFGGFWVDDVIVSGNTILG